MPPHGMEVGLGHGHCVTWDPAPPQFSVHVYCGQMAECIKMPLGMEAGLGPGHLVLDGDPAPPQKGAQQHAPFSAHFYRGQTAGWLCHLVRR